MNTPVEKKPTPVTQPISQDTVVKVSATDQPTTEHPKIAQLDHVFPEKFGQYRVLKLLGKGGMGSVYLAEDPVLHRKVAIKTLRPELAINDVAKGRFLREAVIVSALKHEHIVTIYSVGEEYGIPYLAMEYLEGHSLEDIIQRKKLTIAQIIRLGREIARALSVAHAKNLIHRDIKPANIWLEIIDKKAGKTRVKILDFGLARYVLQEGGPTQAGMVVGTPHYISPEQARGKDLDPRSDLFSLGVVLYRLSTKTFPFDGEDTLALLTALAVDTPKSMREHNPAIPAAFDQLVLKLLEKNPDCRPATAQIVADELQALYRQVEQGIDPATSAPVPALMLSAPLLNAMSSAPTSEKPYQKLIVFICAMIAFFCIALVILIGIKILQN